VREVLIGALIVVMLKFRPQGIFPDRHGRPRSTRGSGSEPGGTAGGWRARLPLPLGRADSRPADEGVTS